MLDRITLRKILKIIHLSPKERRQAIRREVYGEMAKAAGSSDAGGDFYVPFWSDAKCYAFGECDLDLAVDERIEVNGRRRNLYPVLRNGFLAWWNEFRCGHDGPFVRAQGPKAQVQLSPFHATIKVENFLALEDAGGERSLVYPYFAHDLALSAAAARLGLWLLTRAFPDVGPEEFLLLDVIQGRAFSLSDCPLHGDEESIFVSRYGQALNERLAILGEIKS